MVAAVAVAATVAAVSAVAVELQLTVPVAAWALQTRLLALVLQEQLLPVCSAQQQQLAVMLQ